MSLAASSPCKSSTQNTMKTLNRIADDINAGLAQLDLIGLNIASACASVWTPAGEVEDESGAHNFSAEDVCLELEIEGYRKTECFDEAVLNLARAHGTVEKTGDGFGQFGPITIYSIKPGPSTVPVPVKVETDDEVRARHALPAKIVVRRFSTDDVGFKPMQPGSQRVAAKRGTIWQCLEAGDVFYWAAAVGKMDIY